MNRCKPILFFLLLLVSFSPARLFGQQSLPASPSQSNTGSKNISANQTQAGNKRILLIIPNYRTSPSLTPYIPLTAKQKFKLATDDSLDPDTFALAAIFAGESELSNSNPSFGHGPKGFGHYFATTSADFAIGNYMSEAVFPVILHEDPRYFRKGSGTGWSRLGYAAGQIFRTHTDSNGSQFNFSEFLGNSAAVAISNAYYPESRNFQDNITKLGIQIGLDMLGNISKEFWPDIMKKFSRKHASQNP